MAIDHSSISSDVYELVRLVEFDVNIAGDVFGLRVELLHSLSDRNWFRAHFWRQEMYRIQPTFPQDASGPVHDPSDERLLIDWSHYLDNDYRDFEAASPDKALQLILDGVRQALVRLTGREI
jgi:hypothetical protein